MDYDVNIAIIRNNPDTCRNRGDILHTVWEKKILDFFLQRKARKFYLLGDVGISRYMVVGMITKNGL